MRVCYTYLMLICAVFTSCSLAAPSLILVADRWCPYNCDPGSSKPGFMVEIARRAFARHDIQIEYQILPWNRAVQGTRTGEFDAIVGAALSDAPDFVFPVFEQGRMQTSFWARKNESWRYQDIGSLQGKVLGVSSGYSYGPELDQYIADPQNALYIQVMYGTHPIGKGLRMLAAGRIDLMLEDESVLRHYLATRGPDLPVTLAGRPSMPPDFANVYVAFSPAMAESVQRAELLGRETAAMRQSGELSRILADYGLQDWRAP
ncbi:transporter substrate-binding domain-containing protein [Bowmanella dokdonensis]|uniref:Transporter substrate-binding domain-containing protein n=1 Tax=Bowmanella dokdonensis TaxID=751969 RepID=A0A939IRS2_9ALTE|nr:transporter substrate-binding domain-containing protein [Bowmanella dokdonensis]